jgi:hypothetical protein
MTKSFSQLQKNLDHAGMLFKCKCVFNRFIRSLMPDKCTFLPLLESLAKVDETVVREQAVRSLTNICLDLSDAEM